MARVALGTVTAGVFSPKIDNKSVQGGAHNLTQIEGRILCQAAPARSES